MEELIKTFHIDAKLMLAQLVNFAIVLFVLHRFAYKPVLKALNDRAKKIEQGLKDSEAASQKLSAITEQEKDVLKKAREEAQAVLARAEEQARKSKDEIAVAAKAQAERIMQDAQKRIEDEKVKMFAEVKGEIADLVVLAAGKILAEKIDPKKEGELLSRILK